MTDFEFLTFAFSLACTIGPVTAVIILALVAAYKAIGNGRFSITIGKGGGKE